MNKSEKLAKGLNSFIKKNTIEIPDAETSKRLDVATLDKTKERLGLRIDRDLKKKMKEIAYQKYGSSEKVSLVAEEAFFDYVRKNENLIQ